MGLHYDAMAFQRRLVYRLALERDMEPGRTARAWSLAKADEQRRLRRWSYSWHEDSEDTDEVLLLSDVPMEGEPDPEVLGIIGGIRRTTADTRLAAAWLAQETIASERRTA